MLLHLCRFSAGQLMDASEREKVKINWRLLFLYLCFHITTSFSSNSFNQIAFSVFIKLNLSAVCLIFSKVICPVDLPNRKMASKLFSVIKFLSDDTSEFVPTKWIQEIEGRLTVRFPYKKNTKTLKLQQDSSSEPISCWPQWDVEIIKSYGKYFHRMFVDIFDCINFL